MASEELVEWLDSERNCRQWVVFEPQPGNTSQYKLSTDTGKTAFCQADDFVQAVKRLNMVWGLHMKVWKREAMTKQCPQMLPANNEDYEE